MKWLTCEGANKYLQSIGMEIGNWNQITNNSECRDDKCYMIKHEAPKNALELFSFSQYVAGWLPKGEWKIFQIDNSTYLGPVQTHFFGRLLFGAEIVPNLIENRTFLFEYGNDGNDNGNTELLISNLIYTFLLFECHGYVVSSNSTEGQLLAIQDGFVYFSSKNKDIFGAETLLKNFECTPLLSPQWIREIIAARQ